MVQLSWKRLCQATAFWVYIIHVTLATTITDCFNVQSGNAASSCDAQASTLATWSSEAQALVAAGLQAFEDANNEDSPNHSTAQNYLLAYLLLKPEDYGDDEYRRVNSYLSRINTFYSGGGMHDRLETPWLFCDSTWARPRSRHDAAQGADGDVITMTDDFRVTHLVAIEDLPQYEDFLWTRDENTGTLIENNDLIPYWMDITSGGYIFDSAPEKGQSLNFCSGATYGGTQTVTSPNTMTICPIAFTDTSHSTTLGGTVPARRMSISMVIPRSATFFHETVHLVVGSAATTDVTYKWSQYGAIIELIRTGQNQVPEWTSYDNQNSKEGNPAGYTYTELIHRNPESYVWFCVGYWYFLQTWDNLRQGQKWSFEDGWAKTVTIS